jgi:hypothetical protein
LKPGLAYGLVQILELPIVAASVGFLVAFDPEMVRSTLQVLIEGVTGIVLLSSLLIVSGAAKRFLMVAICKAATSKSTLRAVPLSGSGCLFVVSGIDNLISQLLVVFSFVFCKKNIVIVVLLIQILIATLLNKALSVCKFEI